MLGLYLDYLNGCRSLLGDRNFIHIVINLKGGDLCTANGGDDAPPPGPSIGFQVVALIPQR